MTPHPVASASAHKEIAPPHAANPPPQVPFNLLQLLADADSSTANGTSATDSGGQAAATIRSDHSKHHTDDADASNQAAALAVPPALTPQLVTKATSAAASGNQAGDAQAVLPAAAAQAASVAAAAGNGNGPNGTPTTPPPGAAELEARVSVGAQTLISGPAPAVDGLWHHIGQAAPNAGEPGSSDDAADDSTADNNTGPAAQPDAKLAAVETEASLAKAHAAAATAAAAAQPDSDTGAGTSPNGTASAANANATAALAALPTPDGSTSQANAAPQNAPALPPAVLQQPLPVYQQVAINLRQAAQIGTGRIEIQLKPESLGAIHVKLDVTHDGHISAVISADRSDTLNMLKQDSSGLQQALRDAGLQADSGSLSFNLRGDGQGFTQGWQPPSPAQPMSSISALRDPGPIVLPQLRYRSHAGAVDIEV